MISEKRVTSTGITRHTSAGLSSDAALATFIPGAISLALALPAVYQAPGIYHAKNKSPTVGLLGSGRPILPRRIRIRIRIIKSLPKGNTKNTL